MSPLSVQYVCCYWHGVFLSLLLLVGLVLVYVGPLPLRHLLTNILLPALFDKQRGIAQEGDDELTAAHTQFTE